MKKIEAIISEDKLGAVKNALSEIGIVGFNVMKVSGRGRGAGIELKWRTGTYVVEMMPSIQINIVLSDHNVDATVKAIQEAARTGNDGEKGDGVIFVLPVEKAIRISSGEEDRDALAYQGDIDTKG